MPPDRCQTPELPLHIALLTKNLETGGVQRVMAALANALLDEGQRVSLYVLEDSGPLRQRLSPAIAVRVLSPGRTAPALARLLWRHRDLSRWLADKRFRRAFSYATPFAEQLAADQPDVLLTRDMRTNCTAALAAALARPRTKLIMGLGSHCIALDDPPNRSVPARGAGPERPWNRHLSRSCLRRASAFVAASRGLEKEARPLIATSIPSCAIYNPVVHSGMREAATEPVDHPWFRSRPSPLILAVGRLTPVKGFDVLLRAFAQARQERQCKLVLLGYNSRASGQRQMRSQLEKLAENLGVRQDFDILPLTHNPYPYLAHADLFALSSNAEGFGNVLVEALYFGLPIVSTDCQSGPREILADGRYGTLVPVGDAQSLAKALLTGLSSKVDRSLQICRAQEFSVQKAATKYLGLFNDVLKA